jgi:hypothetical protein
VIKIDKYNCEAFFLDYWENRLSDRQEAELFHFLKENPHLRPVFESFESIGLEPEKEILYAHKATLKSSVIEGSAGIDAGNYTDYLIRASENELNEQEHRDLDIFLKKNPALRNEYRLYKLAYVEPDEEILFAQKDQLYRKASRTISLPGIYRMVAAAAIIMISFGLYQLYLKPDGPSSVQHGPEPNYLSMEMIPAGPLYTYTIPEASLHRRHIPSPAIHLPGPKYQPVSSMPVLAFRSKLQISAGNQASLALQLPYLPAQLIIDDYLFEQQRQYFAEQEQVKERTLFGRIINGLFKKVTDEVEPTLSATQGLRDGKVSFWDLAESGIDGYNYLTNNDVMLVRTLDEKGKTRKVRLLTNNQ